jgi:hypothetical protein
MLFESENEIMEKKSCFSNTYIHFFPGKKKHVGMGKEWTTPRKVEKALVFAAKK